jgi:pimeloyl-ACP methyl ester carboxylesterase
MIDHLEASSAHVVATSFAAGSAVWAAAEHPNRIRSITLIGPFARAAKINPVIGALFWLMLNNPFRVKMWLNYYRSLYPTQKPPDFGEYLADLGDNLRQPGRFKAFATLAGSSRQPSEERLSKVKVPTLVIMGTKDPDFPDPVAEARFVAEQTRGRMELIDRAGHYPQTEMPDQTAPFIIDFLRQER